MYRERERERYIYICIVCGIPIEDIRFGEPARLRIRMRVDTICGLRWRLLCLACGAASIKAPNISVVASADETCLNYAVQHGAT